MEAVAFAALGVFPSKWMSLNVRTTRYALFRTLQKNIAPIPHLTGEPGRLPLNYVAGAGLEPATYAL